MTMYSYEHVQCHVLFFTLVMVDTSIQFNYVIWKAMSLIRFECFIVTKREGPYTTALDDRAPDVDLSNPDLLIQTQTS
jgi:hypothetical protein